MPEVRRMRRFRDKDGVEYDELVNGQAPPTTEGRRQVADPGTSDPEGDRGQEGTVGGDRRCVARRAEGGSATATVEGETAVAALPEEGVEEVTVPVPAADELEQLLDDHGQLIGWRVKSTERYHLDVMIMFYNYRLVTTYRDDPGLYDRYWCYAGRTPAALLAAVAAAFAWDGADDTEPDGWQKNGQTQERRPPA